MTAFSSLVEGKNEEMSTTELSGGARIHYIFQSIFVKSLEVCMLLYGLPSYDTEILIYAQQCSQTSKACLVLNSQSAPGQLIRVDLELARPKSGRVPVEEMAWYRK